MEHDLDVPPVFQVLRVQPLALSPRRLCHVWAGIVHLEPIFLLLYAVGNFSTMAAYVFLIISRAFLPSTLTLRITFCPFLFPRLSLCQWVMVSMCTLPSKIHSPVLLS